MIYIVKSNVIYIYAIHICLISYTIFNSWYHFWYRKDGLDKID